jgi:hypothetical protein
MKGDFSRVTFDPGLRFTRVLEQQGRVRLDADSNEQAEILLHHLRTLAQDMVGPHAAAGDAFAVAKSVDENNQVIPSDFELGPGNYYVGGLLAENPSVVRYTAQRGYPFDDDSAIQAGKVYLAYLDVWERIVTSIEEPRIAETALGGLETSVRSQLVWQVRLLDLAGVPDTDFKGDYPKFRELLLARRAASPGTGQLAASLQGGAAPMDNRYRGPDNQLYRIEIHEPGGTWTGQNDGTKASAATFKWSRENGSVVFPVVDLAPEPGANGTRVRLRQLGLDRRLDLQKDDWVELVDDKTALRNQVHPLLRVKQVDREQLLVTLEGQAAPGVGAGALNRAVLRRWDHGRQRAPGADAASRGGAPIVQADGGRAVKLEYGIEIRFKPNARYQRGDYWLIAARARGGIEWSLGTSELNGAADQWKLPKGEQHHYAPLAVVSFDNQGALTNATSMRRVINQLWQ